MTVSRRPSSSSKLAAATDSSERAARRAAAQASGRHPAPLNEGRSRNMQANRRTDTKPEIRLRSALHRLGLRFRKDLRVTAGEVKVRPDIVFTRRRVAVFVDGCFWHGCPEHGRTPSVNGWYWSPKLQRNRDRDARVTAALEAHDWQVLRFWEHESLDDAVAAVASAVRGQAPRGAYMMTPTPARQIAAPTRS